MMAMLQPSSRISSGWVILGLLLLATTGCGSKGARNPVSGTVEFTDGTPLETGRVVFESMDGKTGFTAEVTSNGEFKVDTATIETKPGEYAVTVIAFTEIEVKLDPKTGAHMQPDPPVSLVDAKYGNRATSPLKATIETGTNQLTFEVEHPGGASAQPAESTEQPAAPTAESVEPK